METETIGSPILWGGFVAFVLAMLAADLGVFNRGAHTVSVRKAAIWSGVCLGCAMAFNGLVWWWFGSERALEFSAGYVIEAALAVDNIFVFVVIFSGFGIPDRYQHRVLFWGVTGALVMRAVFILVGGALLQQFHWMMYVFGGILAVTGIRLMRAGDHASSPAENPVIRLITKFMPVTDRLSGEAFTVVENGRRVATPLLLALVAVEVTDVIFAVDSIPAIFAVTDDPFIVFTSNIFAILGLRSLYFLLADIVTRFIYLKQGLALVLILVGAKMLAMDFYKVPIVWSLGLIITILAGSIVASLIWGTAKRPEVSTALDGELTSASSARQATTA